MMVNRITKILGIEKPIIQGPLFWLTNAKLVAAVSDAGGLGVLGAAAGQYKPTGNTAITVDNMRKEIVATKKLTDKPFGLSLMFDDDPSKDRHAQPMIDLMVEENIPVAVVYANHYIPKWFDLLKEKGIKIVYRPATPTKAVVKDAVDHGVDVIVATGFDEGGTVPSNVIGTFSIVPYIVDFVDGQVPVMAAGGIADERGVRAAFDLGAEGIFAGTAFLATDEAPMAENIKEQLVKLDAEDEVMFKAEPKYYRSIPGTLPAKLVKMSEEGKSNEEVWRAADHYKGMQRGMVEGDLDNGYASFGMGMSFIKKIEPVKTVVDRLAKGIPTK